MKKELYKTQISKPLKRNSTWTEREDQILIEKAKEFNYKNWSSVSSFLPGRTPIQCSARYKRIRPGIVKGTWTPQEDAEVIKLFKKYGKDWSKISKFMRHRTGKQIRDRFLNSLDSNLIKKKFSQEEDEQIMFWYKIYGNAWCKIAQKMKGRTGDMVKNRFYSSLKKTHLDLAVNNSTTVNNSTNINNEMINSNNTIPRICNYNIELNNRKNCGIFFQNNNNDTFNINKEILDSQKDGFNEIKSGDDTREISFSVYGSKNDFNLYNSSFDLINTFNNCPDLCEPKLQPFHIYKPSQSLLGKNLYLSNTYNNTKLSELDQILQSKLELLHSLVINQMTFGIKRETLLTQLKVLQDLKKIVVEKENSLFV